MLFIGIRVNRFNAPVIAYRVGHLGEPRLLHPYLTPQRSLTIIKRPEAPCVRRRRKCKGAGQRERSTFDTPFRRKIYSRRMRTVEPVIVNIEYAVARASMQ
jgi:hypothetical protein